MKLKPEVIELENYEYLLEAKDFASINSKLILNGKDYTNKCVGLVLIKEGYFE